MIARRGRLERLIRQRIEQYAPKVTGNDFVTVRRVGQNFEIGLTLDAREKLAALDDPAASYGSEGTMNLGPAGGGPLPGPYGPY